MGVNCAIVKSLHIMESNASGLTCEKPVAVLVEHIQVHGHCVGRAIDDVSAASGVHVIPEALEDLLQLLSRLLDMRVVEEEGLGILLEHDVVVVFRLEPVNRLVLVVQEYHLGQDIP